MRFEPMTKDDYNAYISSAVSAYETELLCSGRFATRDKAHEFAVWDYEDIFKNGYNTSDIFLYNILADGQKIGVIWFINEDRQGIAGEAFIGDFLIDEAYRNKGYGYEALLLTEEYVKRLGLKEIRLGVLSHNSRAKRLYEKAGYTLFKQRAHDCVMQKIL